jgi:lysophospholipase L1-like esterase
MKAWSAAAMVLGFTLNGAAKADDLEFDASTPIPATMGALGDSISAAAMASYSRTDVLKPWVVLMVLNDLLDFALNHTFRKVEKRHLSWSSGLDPFNRVTSHALRIRALNPNLRVFSAAVSGANIDDVLSNEMPAMQNWSRTNFSKGSPDYVTLLIGANDVCRSRMNEITPIADFENKTRQILKNLFAQNPRVKVVVSSIPAIEQLVQAAGRSRLFGFGVLSKCQDLWNRIPVCENVLRAKTDIDRQTIARTVREYNGSLKRAVQDFAQDYPGQIRFAADVHDTTITPNDLAVDCFHPNILGQSAIAETTFKQTWWQKDWAKIAASYKQKNPPSAPKSDDEPDFEYEGLGPNPELL